MTGGDGRAGGARVLVAEDERHLALLLSTFLVGRAHQVDVVHDGTEALARLTGAARCPYDVALLDVQMPGVDGLAVLRAARALATPPQVVVMTGNGTVDTALAAMEEGAYDYVAKPYRMAEVELLVRRAAERRRLEGALAAATSLVDEGEGEPVTRHAPLRAVLDLATRAAQSLGAAVVHGEPGTGRGHLARHLHRAAGGGPFVRLDATDAGGAAHVAERLATARGGTLHVRAVDALPRAAQRVVADALADDEPDAPRVVATTARAAGSLALDAGLADRLSALVVELPPLRDRVGDVAALTEAFVRRFGGASPPAVTAAALARLERHRWPGNVTELRLVIEGAVARAGQGVVDAEHLFLDPTSSTP